MNVSASDTKPEATAPGKDFIREIVEDDLAAGRRGGRVATRFPPEPNGYLHIGHAKSICLNFGIAQEYSGLCNLRYDDTNPAKEEEEYVRSIEEDVRWLGFEWSNKLWASDYFDTMYDWAHGFEDSIEKINHSICTLEFENHRPLYDWFIDAVNEGRKKDERIWHPQQIEFARLNLTYTMLSKRKLLQLVQEKIVRGWDDPRMPTISGYRRRGFTPESIRAFCKHIGVNKFNSAVEINVLENFLREDLNRR